MLHSDTSFRQHGEDMKPLKELNAPEIAAELLAAHPQLGPAIELATYLHEGQCRGPRLGQDSPPYIEHPLRVAARLSRAGVTDTVLLTTAILHDTVEDCGERFSKLTHLPPSQKTSLLFLEKEFGPETAGGVKLLTTSGPYFAHVTTSVRKDPRALIGKTSDWLDNAGSLHHSPLLAPSRVPKYRPLTSVFLEECDRQYEDVQMLMNGNFDILRGSILRAGFRLELLSQSSSTVTPRSSNSSLKAAV